MNNSQLVRQSSSGMTFLLRLSLANNGWGGEMRSKDSTEMRIRDLLDMGIGRNSCFVWLVVGFEQSGGLSTAHFSNLCTEAMAVETKSLLDYNKPICLHILVIYPRYIQFYFVKFPLYPFIGKGKKASGSFLKKIKN